MRFFLSVLALVLPAAACAAVPCYFPDLPPIQWQTYGKARSALLESGFEPVDQSNAPTNDAETSAWLAGWYELKSCAGTGTAPCRFEWEKDGQQIAIITTRGKVTRTLCD